MYEHKKFLCEIVGCNVFELQQSIQDNRSFQRLKAYDFGYYSKVNSNEVAIVLNIDMGKQGLDVSVRANFMLRLQTQSGSLYTWLTGICGPIYNSNFS